jgi:anaphase-promoting complex subunit 1
MAKVESLGLHTPVALPYLIREGLLPKEPKKEHYQWETYVFDDAHGEIEEELLITKTCVAWSQGQFLRNIYRFELEQEDVNQAILTSFPHVARKVSQDNNGKPGPSEGYGRAPSKSRASLGPAVIAKKEQPFATSPRASARALVVFLKTKAHIYFLSGSSHIVDLPFEIDRAFPAPRGCILRRKPSVIPTLASTPQVPPAPPNSFFSQIPTQSSYLQSPTFARSFHGSQPARPSPLGGSNGKLQALFQDAFGLTKVAPDEGMATLYSFTSPFSEFGILCYSLQHQKPRLLGKHPPGLSVEFEALDPSEEIIYVSPASELSANQDGFIGPLILIVTANPELQTVTVWHAWYVEEKSLRELLEQRAAHKAAKTRRRSSFMSVNLGTGATTPAVRQRDQTRESMAGPGMLRLPGEPSTTHATATSRKPTRQEEEAVMASQMDPDYQPAASQPPPRESRRISSLNSDLRASQSAAAASFGGVGGRRNPSFGAPNERRSLGHRKSRGSTPGSTFSRSLALDDDTMDLDSTTDLDEENAESIVRHIRATFEVAGADNVLGGAEEGPRRELVVRKLHSFPFSQHSSPVSVANEFRVAVLNEHALTQDTEDQRLTVFIHDRQNKDLVCLKISAKQRTLWPELPYSAKVAIPMVLGECTMGKCSEIIHLKDSKVKAILLSGQGLLFSGENPNVRRLPPSVPYRVYSPYDLSIASIHGEACRDKTLEVPDGPIKLTHSGPAGVFDEVDVKGVHHRRRLQLRPQRPHIDRLLEVCQAVLPEKEASRLRRIWCMAYAQLSADPERLTGTASDMEWISLVATVLYYAVKLIDAKAKAALNSSRLATGKKKATENLQARPRDTQHFSHPVWAWMEQKIAPRSETAVSSNDSNQLDRRKDQVLTTAAALALDLVDQAGPAAEQSIDAAIFCAVKLMLGLHVYQEEQKLSILTSRGRTGDLAPVIAQLGSLLGIQAWSFAKGTYYYFEGAHGEHMNFIKTVPPTLAPLRLLDEPVGVFQWFEHALKHSSGERYPSLAVIKGLDMAGVSPTSVAHAAQLTPRTSALSDILAETRGLSTDPTRTVELMAKFRIGIKMLETLPEGVAAPFREAIARCERQPPTTWSVDLLRLVGREDLDLQRNAGAGTSQKALHSTYQSPRDVQSICQALDQPVHTGKTRAAARHAVSQLIFCEDRRLVEAVNLMHYSSTQAGECPKEPEWDDAFHFEQQRRIMNFMTLRMMALPAGDGMIHYDCVTPLLTEKYATSGFTTSVLMQPMGHNLTIDRQWLTEEKCGWAYFHAGVSAGMRISRTVTGIDTSWIAFNKPSELTNRHAGLLLALGLGGHLRSLAKWLSFKYLTPKHTMTSVGLLLGLSASYIGSMDSLITRMLSVHVTRMLPPGAAELNVSPITQTAGLMGIGLLYYNTQHRRMSEIMLSEIEYTEVEDPDSGPDPLRDESYRLAAGFALGLINLGRGRHLNGLHGMFLPERLLAMAVGPRPVHAVHVFDRATAGAIMAVALVYMKSGDQSIARKVDIPDTEAQFDHVRPDMLMLRAMARHIVMWDAIEARGAPSHSAMNEGPQESWIQASLPLCYRDKLDAIDNAIYRRYPMSTSDVPFYNIATGLAWALALKYAGTGNTAARDEILHVIDVFYNISGDTYYYDAKLTRSTVRRCIDVLALSAATVMAGTGDIKTFRYLRRLHGRTDAETSYGSHMAAHLAIGALFMGGGTYTFGTSDLATAALIISFYPLFPTEIMDNRVHLQALRHFWVFAAEARCLVIENIDTHRPISIPIKVTTRDGSEKLMTAPCLLPDLDSIATVQTNDPAYWRVTLDFASNPAHLSAFRAKQIIFVRKCPASEAHGTPFLAALAALNDAQSSRAAQDVWQSIFNLPALSELDKADIELILPPDVHSSMRTDERTMVVDDRLVLSRAVTSNDRDALWNLRILFAWAERAKEEGDGRLRWLGREVVEVLRGKVEERQRRMRAVGR